MIAIFGISISTFGTKGIPVLGTLPKMVTFLKMIIRWGAVGADAFGLLRRRPGFDSRDGVSVGVSTLHIWVGWKSLGTG